MAGPNYTGTFGAIGGIQSLRDIIAQRITDQKLAETTELERQKVAKADALAALKAKIEAGDYGLRIRNQALAEQTAADKQAQALWEQQNPELMEVTGALSADNKPIIDLVTKRGGKSIRQIAAAPKESTSPGSDFAQLVALANAERAKAGQPPLSSKDVIDLRGKYGMADDKAPVFRPIVDWGRGVAIMQPGTTMTSPILEADSQGGAKPIGERKTSAEKAQDLAKRGVDPLLESVIELADQINVSQGIWATARGEAAKVAAKYNYDDDVAEYEAMIEAFAPMWAKAMGHWTGTLTQKDVDSARMILPAPTDSRSLKDRKIARIRKILGPRAGASALNDESGTGPAAPGSPARPEIYFWGPDGKAVKR